jgi:hypothetical protein
VGLWTKPTRDPVDIWSKKKSGKGGRTGTELEDRDEPEVEDEGPLRTPKMTAPPERKSRVGVKACVCAPLLFS